MPVSPDIVVTKRDSPEIVLAVEVKAGSVPAHLAEAQLKDYMAHQSCPLGMLVTPELTFFFRNLFTGYGAETIRKVGECRTQELLLRLPNTEADLELRVEQWLESVTSSGSRPWPASAAEAIESLVLPAVMSGVVRATGPRWRRTGS
jgi:hypothetical protein